MGKAVIQQNRNRTTQAGGFQQLRITLPSGVEMAGPVNPTINNYLNQIFQNWTSSAGTAAAPSRLSPEGRRKISLALQKRHSQQRQQQQAGGTQAQRTQARPKTMTAGGSQ